MIENHGMTISASSDKMHYISSIFPIRLLIPALPVILLQVGTIEFRVFANFDISPNMSVMLVHIIIINKGILGCGSTCLDIGRSKTGERTLNSLRGNYVSGAGYSLQGDFGTILLSRTRLLGSTVLVFRYRGIFPRALHPISYSNARPRCRPIFTQCSCRHAHWFIMIW
jgi:hypothetical protein